MAESRTDAEAIERLRASTARLRATLAEIEATRTDTDRRSEALRRRRQFVVIQGGPRDA
jgi:hypothetical protein